MEKTKAQIAADKLYPAPNRSDYHTDTEYESVLLQYEVNKLIWLAGYNAATLKWSDEEVVSMLVKFAVKYEPTSVPIDIKARLWLKSYKDAK